MPANPALKVRKKVFLVVVNGEATKLIIFRLYHFIPAVIVSEHAEIKRAGIPFTISIKFPSEAEAN